MPHTKNQRERTSAVPTPPPSLTPTMVTIEIAHQPRPRSRRRAGATLRVAVTYRIEMGEGERPSGPALAALIRLAKRRTIQAYRCDSPLDERKESVPPGATARVSLLETGRDEETADALDFALPPTTHLPTHIEQELITQEVIHQELTTQGLITQEVTPPRPLTKTQLRTLEIMARQLQLMGKGLSDLLGLRYNKTHLEGLTYREAAGLIAHFSAQLRQQLLKEEQRRHSVQSMR